MPATAKTAIATIPMMRPLPPDFLRGLRPWLDFQNEHFFVIEPLAQIGCFASDVHCVFLCALGMLRSCENWLFALLNTHHHKKR